MSKGSCVLFCLTSYLEFCLVPPLKEEVQQNPVKLRVLKIVISSYIRYIQSLRTIFHISTIMASRLRTPTLGLAGLSMCLCLAIIGTGGRSLHVYYDQRTKNEWLLPLWPNHFDMRELQTLIGTAGAIFVLNAVLAVALLVNNVCILPPRSSLHLVRVPSLIQAIQLPTNGLVLGSSLLSTIVGVISIAFPTWVNWRAPTTDTMRTWTCRWSNYPEILVGYGPPKEFNTMCSETVSPSPHSRSPRIPASNVSSSVSHTSPQSPSSSSNSSSCSSESTPFSPTGPSARVIGISRRMAIS